MAAAAAGPLITSLTQTHITAPYSSSHAPSMADSLPTLDFKFDELRAAMSSFTRRFDAFIEAGRRRVLDERNGFVMRVKEVGDTELTTLRTIETLSTTSKSHSAALASQNAETSEMHTAITSLTSTRDQHTAHVSTLKTSLSNTRSAISTRRAALKSQSSYLSHQSSLNAPELEFWERHLGLRIEGTGEPDRIRFVFEGLDSRSSGREAWCVLDVGRKWEVVECRPRLEGEKVKECLGRTTGGGEEDLKGFLGGMRGLFAVEMGR